MRIDLRTVGLGPPEDRKTDRATTNRGHDVHSTGDVDKARFSFDQARIHSLEKQALEQPEVRQQRVELLRQAIGKGEYAVSDGQVAAAMIADLAAGSSG